MDRRHVDDRSAPTLLDHPPGRRLRGNKRGGQVHTDYPVPFLQADVDERLARSIPGVVDQHVDSAQRARQLVDRPRGSPDRVEIELPGLGARAGSFDLLHHALGTLLHAVPGQADVEAGRGQRDDRGAADAAVASGDDRYRHARCTARRRPVKTGDN
jgi:hypothetical protein